MTRIHLFSLLATGLLAAALSGCATPDARIKKNPELFNSLSPEIQANVRQGKIDIGYPKAAVQLALGPADRQYTRRTAGGQKEVWSYTATYSTTDRQRVDARVRNRGTDGNLRTTTESVWVDVEQKHEYDRLRVEFEGDLVTAIESLDR